MPVYPGAYSAFIGGQHCSPPIPHLPKIELQRTPPSPHDPLVVLSRSFIASQAAQKCGIPNKPSPISGHSLGRPESPSPTKNLRVSASKKSSNSLFCQHSSTRR